MPFLAAALTPSHRYRFRGAWALAAPPDAVYARLEAVDGYPAWWPQIREVNRADAATGTARVRSFLPYDLTVAVRARRHDPVARVLEIVMTGDIEGWARWTVLPCGPAGCTARFEQDVEARKLLLRRLALLARPLFVANHAWMMRAGRLGLRALLAGGTRGI
ncbi:polyketide cyclase [Streptomyces rectiverticillatus]|uniref:SRPBCC family protein n=1 Tax=Streptomyces rectiverticillatus TaxID=173860 RepID=UPI0015C37796|nr:SRPBCC family protein [Streptomyces rectiverticillatus]QLE71244.1 polyketide cyclase [Streptomyces rectiverticillatus]